MENCGSGLKDSHGKSTKSAYIYFKKDTLLDGRTCSKIDPRIMRLDPRCCGPQQSEIEGEQQYWQHHNAQHQAKSDTCGLTSKTFF